MGSLDDLNDGLDGINDILANEPSHKNGLAISGLILSILCAAAAAWLLISVSTSFMFIRILMGGLLAGASIAAAMISLGGLAKSRQGGPHQVPAIIGLVLGLAATTLALVFIFRSPSGEAAARPEPWISDSDARRICLQFAQENIGVDAADFAGVGAVNLLADSARPSSIHVDVANSDAADQSELWCVLTPLWDGSGSESLPEWNGVRISVLAEVVG